MSTPKDSSTSPTYAAYWRALLRAVGYLRPYKALSYQAGVLVLLSTLLSLLTPWPLKIVIDNVLQNRPLPPSLASALALFGGSQYALLIAAVAAGFLITFGSNALTVMANYVNTRLHESIVLDFRSDLFQQAQRLSLAYHDQRQTGKVIFAISNQGGAVAGLLLAIPPLVQSVLTLVGMFWVSLHINAELTLLSLTVVPLIYCAVWYYMTHIQERLRRVRIMEADSLQMIHEGIQMLRVIVAFGREAYEFNRFRQQAEKTINERVIVTVQQTAFSLAINTATALGTALVLGAGSYYALQGRLSAGELLVVLSYISMVYHPLEQISANISSLQQAFIGMEVGCALLDKQPDIADKPDAVDLPDASGDVIFDEVCFNYKDRPETLKGISFEARRGQVIAVVGQTGAGKTTLASLIPRFYEVTSGRILIGGIDIRDVTLRSLRHQISIVLQEPLLFAGSIADNIRYGRLDATMEEIIDAAKAANAHDFVMGLPKKYDTLLGERGVLLSGGERQRISVARAFLKDAPILILDEPTSSIDSKTEGVILDALDRLMVGRTTFMVAHRLSTIHYADRILVLSRGILVESGTHAELLDRDGLYRQLHDMQTGQVRRRMQAAIAASAFGEKAAKA